MGQDRVILPDSFDGQEFGRCLNSRSVKFHVLESTACGDLDLFHPALVQIGAQFDTHLAIEVLQLAAECWPSLRYVVITSDERQTVPTGRCHELFIGAPLGSWHRCKCRPWSARDWRGLDGRMNRHALYEYVRRRYTHWRGAVATHVEFVGGPRDGDCNLLEGLPADQPPVFVVRDKANGRNVIYELSIVDDAVRYRFSPVRSRPA